MYHFNTSATADQSNTECHQQGFSALYNRYHVRLLESMTRLIRDPESAADITAIAFASALKKLAQFRGQSSFYTWLHAIAMNEARKSWRRNPSVSLESICADNRVELFDADGTARAVEQSELRVEMQKALRKLPAAYRSVLTDHFIQGRSVREIAHRRGIPVGTVLSRIFSGKRIIRQAWKSENQIRHRWRR